MWNCPRLNMLNGGVPKKEGGKWEIIPTQKRRFWTNHNGNGISWCSTRGWNEAAHFNTHRSNHRITRSHLPRGHHRIPSRASPSKRIWRPERHCLQDNKSTCERAGWYIANQSLGRIPVRRSWWRKCSPSQGISQSSIEYSSGIGCTSRYPLFRVLVFPGFLGELYHHPLLQHMQLHYITINQNWTWIHPHCNPMISSE